MKIIAMSPAYNLKKETEVVTELFENGLGTLHVRKPLYSVEKINLSFI